MDWKDIAGDIAKFAPVLGGMVGGPVGIGVTAASAVIAHALGVAPTPDAVAIALQNPDAAVKLAQIEKDRAVDLQTLVVQSRAAAMAADTAAIVAVNQTMQAETHAEHWPSYTWRPFIGFALGVNVMASTLLVLFVFIPIMFGSTNMAAAVAALPGVLGALAAVGATTLPVIGVASWFRGKAQADPDNPAQNRG